MAALMFFLGYLIVTYSQIIKLLLQENDGGPACTVQGCNRRGDWCDRGQCLNPIPIRGGRFCPTIAEVTPKISPWLNLCGSLIKNEHAIFTNKFFYWN